MAKRGSAQKAKKTKKEKVQVTDEELVQEEMLLSDEDENDHRKSNKKIHRVTLEDIDAMSDGEDDEIEEWNAEAKALRQAIAEGAFDKINLNKVNDTFEDDEESIESDDASHDQDGEENSEGEEEEEEEEEEEQSDSEQDNYETEAKPTKLTVTTNLKALTTVTSQLQAEKEALPWPEKFDIVSETPLPFGQVTEEGLTIEVHDDLKREVAFYNLALEAVHTARGQCEKYGIPFTRPDDFFAEMVKTDDHMAKVKDRLIFESKKMEAFEQRKSNREQKLRAKEKHAHRIAEKAKAKKQHLRDVEEWANAAKSNRVGGGKVRDDDDDYLARIGAGPNKKRLAANKKYGYGGKSGRFKQNDPKTLNDMSAYNPKGNFSGGKKSTGNKRKGKRARDAARTKR